MEKKAHEYIELKTKYKKWTKKELAGRILVSCKACRDGLEPFIDKRMPFDTFSGADLHYRNEFYRKTSSEGVVLYSRKASDRVSVYDIVFESTEEKCGTMAIEVCEVVK